MITFAEMKFVVPKGGSVNIEEEIMPDGSRVLNITLYTDDTTSHKQECIFRKVSASELSLNDTFMQHEPQNRNEQEFKDLVKKAIKKGLKDFWRPVCDPSLDDDGRIHYERGRKPVEGKDYYWWVENAKYFCPKQGSRLGTNLEYVAFLAVLIKELVASGKSVEWAWNAVCNNSNELGQHWNKARNDFEPTGSREISGWCDLANAFKILAEDKEDGGYWLVGGYCGYGIWKSFRLSDLWHYGDCSNIFVKSCGWLVFDSCPDC